MRLVLKEGTCHFVGQEEAADKGDSHGKTAQHSLAGAVKK